jgi:hypothetical protein
MTPRLSRPTLEVIRGLLEPEYVIAGPTGRDPANGLLMVKSWGSRPDATIHLIKQKGGELDEPDRKMPGVDPTELELRT